MLNNVLFAYGEGHFASTAFGITISLILALLISLSLIFYSRWTYPADRE